MRKSGLGSRESGLLTRRQSGMQGTVRERCLPRGALEARGFLLDSGVLSQDAGRRSQVSVHRSRDT